MLFVHTGNMFSKKEPVYDSEFQRWWIEGKPWTVVGLVALIVVVVAALAYLFYWLYRRSQTKYTVILHGVGVQKVRLGAYYDPEFPPAREGYVFQGWYKNSACTEAWGSRDRVRRDMTRYPKWVKES